MDTRTKLNVLSICSGIGGIELGLHAALDGRTRTVCYVERELSVASILAARMQDGTLDSAPIWTDLRTFDPEPWRGKVDLITGGPPCQPFSVAGAQKGSADPRNLFPEVLRIATGLGLPDLYLETVSGSAILRYYWDSIRPELRELGYSVAEGLFTASETGAPHKRERLFILADCDSGLCDHEEEEICTGGEPSEPRGNELAYARDTGLQGTTRYDCHEKGTVCAGVQSDGDRVRGRTGRGSNELAHSSYERLEGDGPSRQKECENESRTLPFYPPGPKDPRWGWITEHYPELAPALCKVHETEPEICELDNAWKIEDRMAALMMLGNAVVPAQAEHAFISLAERTSEGV